MYSKYAILMLSMIFTVSCFGKREMVPAADILPAKMIYAVQKDYPYGPGYYSSDELPANTAYLTFDDGPCAWTAVILDALAEENVKATFFISGRWNMKGQSGTNFKKHADILLRMKREGHVIGNHTVTHRVLTRMQEAEIKKEILLNQQMLDDALGSDTVTMTTFRPALGCPWLSSVSAGEKKRVADITGRYALTILWAHNMDSSDSWEWAPGEWYRGGPRIDTGNPAFILKKARIYNRVVSGAKGQGIVILMHDTHNTTAEVLPLVIKALKAKGYSFGTVEDLLLWKYGLHSRELLTFTK